MTSDNLQFSVAATSVNSVKNLEPTAEKRVRYVKAPEIEKVETYHRLP